MTEQQTEIKRVRGNIAPLIREFFKVRVKSGNLHFHNRDLLKWVWAFTECAPDSPARIMRLLSDEGELAYRVTNRSGSEYVIEREREPQGRLF